MQALCNTDGAVDVKQLLGDEALLTEALELAKVKNWQIRCFWVQLRSRWKEGSKGDGDVCGIKYIIILVSVWD